MYYQVDRTAFTKSAKMKSEYTNNKQLDFGTDLLNQVGGAIEGGIGGVIGLPLQAIGNAMQRGQQAAFTQQQVAAQKDLNKYNMGLNLDYWNATNAEAQVDHLKKAGLNPALMYAKGGPGGTTGNAGGSVGMGIAAPNQTIAAQEAANTAADINLKNAQADKLKAETPATGQTQDLIAANIASINQGINNAKAQEILTDAQTQTQRLQNSITGETIDDQIATIRATAGKIQNEMQQAARNNWMDQQTVKDRIDLIHATMLGQFIKNNLDKTTTTLNETQKNAIIQKVMQDWKTIGINQQNANTNEGHLKIQQLIKDIPDSKGIILQGLTRLIPNIIF